MSYDLILWSPKNLLGTNVLLAENGYKKSVDCFVRKGENWQVVINEPEDIEPEEIPDEIMQSLPGSVYMIVINFEGSVPERIANETLRFCETLAKNIKGIIEDPQTGTITSPDSITQKEKKS
jgi:hypothetical protein